MPTACAIPQPLLTPAGRFDRSAIMRQAWAFARGQRACAEHRAVAEAETASRATLPAIERDVLTLQDARAIAPMLDSDRPMVAELVAINAHAIALGVRL